MLLTHATRLSREFFATHPEHCLADAETAVFAQLVAARIAGEPIAYLIGEREFYGRAFKVNRHVLIPRPETELLVDCALERLPTKSGEVLELGVGSGASLVTLACERPQLRYTGSDLSPDALAVAQSNAARLAPQARFTWVQSDWFSAINGRFDVIIANPPYIAANDAHLLQGDLRFEPALALASGADGLDALRTLITQAPSHLHAGGSLLVEHGYDQAAAVRALFATAGFGDVDSVRDLSGIERITRGRFRAASTAPQIPS